MAEKLIIFWQIENFRYVIIMGVKMEEILGSFLIPTGKNSQFMHFKADCYGQIIQKLTQ